MTPEQLAKHGLRVKPLEWVSRQANGYKHGLWWSSGACIDRADGDHYLYDGKLFFSHVLATDAAQADYAARIAAALEPIAPPDVAQAARVLSDALANDGHQAHVSSGAKWGEAWKAMAAEYKAEGWTDWPAIFDAALRAIADGETP